ncbi:hypothetical protein ABZ671_01270 [Micromonospora sp. NPDC006766]|uniref:hypothetical protein n=1 Tax=Micromonospora sp. NPDC006766 TaxID=3154778 RepID=UPI0033EE22D6
MTSTLVQPGDQHTTTVFDTLTFGVPEDAALVARIVRNGRQAGHDDEQIAEQITEALAGIANDYRGRPGYEPRVTDAETAMRLIEPLADAATGFDRDGLLARLRADLGY